MSLPNDRGFEEWYGIPGTTNKILNRTSVGHDPVAAPPEFILAGKKGETSHRVEEYNADAWRRINAEITRRIFDSFAGTLPVRNLSMLISR